MLKKKILAVFCLVVAAAGCAGTQEKEVPAAQPETQETQAEPEAQEAQAEPEFEPEAQPVVRPEVEGEAQVHHIVQKGETLYGIGKMYGVPWKEIAEANNISDVKALKVGTKLIIPGAKNRPEGK